MEQQDDVRQPDLARLANSLPVDEPTVRRFVTEALGCIDRLERQVDDLQQGLLTAGPDPLIERATRDRLDCVIEDQRVEVRELRATLDRVRALEAIARWSAALDDSIRQGQRTRASIDVDDLRRALEDDSA